MIKLYYAKGSCSMVPHVALEMAKAGYEAVQVAIDIPRDEYRKLNPAGSVPMLQDEDFLLTQNVAILNYIDGKFEDAKLFGTPTLQERAHLDQWLLFFNADVHPTFGPIFHVSGVVDGEEAQKKARAKAVERLHRFFGRANDLLQGQLYVGKEFTIVDVYLYVITRWTRSISELDLSDFTHLWEHFARVESNEYVQKVLEAEGLKTT